MTANEDFLKQAIQLAEASVASGGGPFGALVVKDGVIIGRGNNRVTLDNDPTAHAEVQAIRDACRRLGDYQLSGCELYVSCAPCPMCLSAAYWARLDAVWFVASREQAAAAGFDDQYIGDQLALEPAGRDLPAVQVSLSEAEAPFKAWLAKGDRREY